MSALKGNCLVAQSGGPTAVINASICGVIQEAAKSDAIQGIYGAYNGILGVLREEIFDLGAEDPETIEMLKTTPSAAVGSCRYKLKKLEENRADYERVLEVFKAHNIRYFFYAGGGSGLFCKGTNSTGFLIVHNPDALPTHPVLRLVATMPLLGWLLLLLLAVMVLGGWLLVRRHHREIRSRAVIPGDGNHLREARLHLLEDLELSGHGAIAPLRSLRRLLWLLDALKTGIEFNQEMNSRFREIWTDCHEDDLPRLLVILDRARAASLDNPSIETAAGALQKIQSQLAALKEDDFSAARLLASGSELNRQGETAETALQSLRREVANLFTADLEQVVRKVLRANHENIQAAGIQVSTGQQAQATGGGDATQTNEATRSLACRIDATELEFILDNLVGNAVRAMNGATERRLRLTWQQAGGMVKMEISDTGIGIATEDRDRILETPSSTKQRGGLGLPRSRRILRKYGGQLTIKSSSPGRGTTFQLLLAQVQH